MISRPSAVVGAALISGAALMQLTVPAAAAPSHVAPARESSQRLTLATGDQVVVHRDARGRVSVAPLPERASTSPLYLYNAHGSWHAVPSAAAPSSESTPASAATTGASLYNLVVNGINASGGKQDGGLAAIVNTDDSLQFADALQFNHGVIRLQVPAGHYAALGFSSHTQTTGSGSTHIVIIDFTVSGDTTVTLDARTATSRISVSTPRATYANTGSFLWQRNSVSEEEPFSVGTIWRFGPGEPPFSTYVTPVATPSVGTQYFKVGFHMTSSPTVTSPYSYDLAFPTVGALATDQHYTASSSQLANVHTRYYSDVSGRASGESRISFFPWQSFDLTGFDQFPAPLDRTEYVLARSDLLWTQEVVDEVVGAFGGIFFDTERTFQPGQKLISDWNREPIGPGVQAATGAATPNHPCPACSGGNGTDLEFEIFPFGSNPPGHTGQANSTNVPNVTESDAYTLSRNGQLIASGRDPLSLFQAVPSGPATYQLQYDVSMSAPWWTHSTSSSTAWTFSDPDSMQSPPPPSWACFNGSSTGCRVISLMFPDYQLPVNLLGEVASGPTAFTLNIGHILNVAVPVTSVGVSLSYDGGSTWHAAHVAANTSGGFRVSYTNPAGPLNAAVRIHATDSGGGVLDQTILNAYTIT